MNLAYEFEMKAAFPCVYMGKMSSCIIIFLPATPHDDSERAPCTARQVAEEGLKAGGATA